MTSDREIRLTRLGYRALALAAKRRHLGDAWVVHLAAKAGRLFEAALRAFGKPAPVFLIAERLGKPFQAVSNILVVLERKGAVRRVRGTEHTLWEAL